MKKLSVFVLALAACFGSTNLSAQNFVYSPSQNMVDTMLGQSSQNFELEITTATPEDITFGWELISNTYPGWTITFCDYGGCWLGIPNMGTMNAITAAEMSSGVNGLFKITTSPGQTYGQGVATFYVYDAADYNRGDTVTIDLMWDGIQSVTANEEKPLTFGPNPVQNSLYVKGGSTMQQMEVLDLTGKVLLSRQFGANASSTIDVSQFPSGVYLVQTITANGERRTQKLIKR